ncbi:5-methyl-dCTP pyrophosphohydrolase [Desulfovibrio sp. DV]|uniref:(deoxy)nucleoside triphosphate pyrophosphohydrolase n=1 Tax=Desulfovibrio sp. DV TaxID=1844708 RepID=UPI00094BA37F|nr:(deoxy)nucleoside triphosphate pyrophosphohydrolase [Desulfovibrio sp. DV]OLN24324.1 5-methyl-dCTP pyrophosphohydrolase [Desulfovibrio sp. DV]
MSAAHKVVDVVAAIIWQGGRYLGVRRPEGKPMAGAYEFPGGKIEPGETPDVALARELREELGITPTAIAFFREKAHSYEHLSVHLHFFHVHAFDGEPLPLEGQDMEWLTPQEGRMRPFLEADRDIVDALALEVP